MCAGATGSLTVSGHTARAIKWQQSTTSDFSSGVSDVAGSGYTSASFTTAALNSTTYWGLLLHVMHLLMISILTLLQ